MIIQSLRVSGFQIMGDPIELQFPGEGRIGILGPNETGKTTLLEAIEFALFGLKRGPLIEESRGNIVTWGKHESKLELEFTSGQDRYVLQRTFGVNGGHRARLIPVMNGEKEFARSVTSLTEIEAKIEQIAGVDRDAFTKLVYIRQKDLDVLKDLAKNRREQLVNKVMGIEVFDKAADKSRSDLSKIQTDVDVKKMKLEGVKTNAETYKTKSADKKRLENGIIEIGLDKKKTERDQAENLLKAYGWLFSYKSTNDVIGGLTQQRTQILQDIQRIGTLKSELSRCQRTLTEYGPKVSNLENVRNEFIKREENLARWRTTYETLTARENELAEKTGLIGKERQFLRENLLTQKDQRFKQFIAVLLASLVLLAVGGFLNKLVIVIIGILVGVSTAWFYRAYRSVDQILTSSGEIIGIQQQIAEARNSILQIQNEIDSLATQTGMRSHEDVDNALGNISEAIKQTTGESSIQAVQTVEKLKQEDLTKLEESKPEAKLTEIDNQLESRKGELERLVTTKPELAGSIQYDKDQHENARETASKLQREYGELEEEVNKKRGSIEEIERQLDQLRSDYEALPKLEDEYKALLAKRDVLKLVVQELNETSKDLRSKVIPHARLIINQILPTLTDGRYSEFEITEDLKFKVHSNEAGGYKEREVFSGGTQDQFLIGLRLAFTQSILDSRLMADKYFLLMDECISSSDEQRKQGIFEVLDAVKKTFSQILIIAHEDVSNFVDHHLIMTRNQNGYARIQSRSW